MTGVIKVVVCAILYVGVMHIKDPMLLIENSIPFSGGSRFPLSQFECSFTMSDTI